MEKVAEIISIILAGISITTPECQANTVQSIEHNEASQEQTLSAAEIEALNYKALLAENSGTATDGFYEIDNDNNANIKSLSDEQKKMIAALRESEDILNIRYEGHTFTPYTYYDSSECKQLFDISAEYCTVFHIDSNDKWQCEIIKNENGTFEDNAENYITVKID